MSAPAQLPAGRAPSFSGVRNRRWFSAFAWLVLAYNIPVIIWGAYVRVSFSGDGCGANWPFCNGQLIPQNMSVPTAIEYTHRMMTSVDSILAIGLCVWAVLLFPKRHAVRQYAILSLVFLLIEALLGAGLVLFRYVAKDQSAGRVWYLSAHLTNTMLLLAALTATAWLASRNQARFRWRSMPGSLLWAMIITVFIGISGTVTALGDTLFPASSLQTGMEQDLASSSSWLLRLRVVHPLIAVTGAAYLLWTAGRVLKRRQDRSAIQAAGWVVGMVVLQLAAGIMNLSLLAPLWMQLTHLFLADALWIVVVLMACETMPHSTVAA